MNIRCIHSIKGSPPILWTWPLRPSVKSVSATVLHSMRMSLSLCTDGHVLFLRGRQHYPALPVVFLPYSLTITPSSQTSNEFIPCGILCKSSSLRTIYQPFSTISEYRNFQKCQYIGHDNVSATIEVIADSRWFLPFYKPYSVIASSGFSLSISHASWSQTQQTSESRSRSSQTSCSTRVLS
jgi:hypothetical protein